MFIRNPSQQLIKKIYNKNKTKQSIKKTIIFIFFAEIAYRVNWKISSLNWSNKWFEEYQ